MTAWTHHDPAVRKLIRQAQARAWEEGKATGFSRAMRYMSDEPRMDTQPANPYREETQ